MTAMRQMVGDKHVYVSEESEIDPVKQTLTMRSKNVTFGNIMVIEELITYSADPAHPSRYYPCWLA